MSNQIKVSVDRPFGDDDGATRFSYDEVMNLISFYGDIIEKMLTEVVNDSTRELFFSADDNQDLYEMLKNASQLRKCAQHLRSKYWTEMH